MCLQIKTDAVHRPNSVFLCGVRIDAVTQADAVAFALGEREEMCTVFTPNAVMLEEASRAPSLRQLLCDATLSLPDGAGVLMAAKRKGERLPSRVAGIDFGEALLASCMQARPHLYLLGGREGIAEKAGEALTLRYPGVKLVGTHHGYFTDGGEEEKAILKEIRTAAPQILYVCLGFPRQEEWILRNRSALPSVRIAAALGGSLDVWSGTVRRAPAFLSRMRLEWAWRMAGDPHKLLRLPALLRFATLSKKQL